MSINDKPITNPIQKHLMAKSLYKRSKRYFDIERLNQLEIQESRKRRIPSTYLNKTIDSQRVNKTFINFDQVWQDRRQQEIIQYKQRMKSQDPQDSETTYTQTIPIFNNRGALSMQKMIPRQLNASKNNFHQNESRFNNYKLNQYKVGRFSSTNPTQQFQTTPNDDKIIQQHDKNKYPEHIFKCMFQYHQKITHRRIPQSIIQPIKHQGRIKKGEELVKVSPFPTLYTFYHAISRQKPSPFHQKCLKRNQYYLKKGAKDKLDFTMNKRKQQMIQKRMQTIRIRKQIPDVKQEMCDLKYFQRKANRDNRLVQ